MTAYRIFALVRLIRDAFHMAGPYRRWLLAIVGIAMVIAAIDAGLVVIAIPLIAEIGNVAGELPPLLLWAKKVYQALNPAGDPTWVLIALVLLMIQARILEACQQTLILWANARILTFIRTTIINKVLSARFGLLDRMDLGALRQIIASETSRVVQAIGEITRYIARLLAVSIKCLFLVYLSPVLTLLFFALAVLWMPVKFVSSRYIGQRSEISIDAALGFMGLLNEMLSGIRQIKLQNRQPEFLEHLRGISDRELTNMAKARICNNWEPAAILVLALACVIGIIVLNRHYAVVEFGVLIGYLMMVARTIPDIAALAQASNAIVQNRRSVQHVARFFNLGDAQHERRDGVIVDPAAIDEIRMNKVSLSYVKETKVLDEICLSARRGELVALVGPSGSGKSSILHLLLSMYTPDSGEILVGGKSITEISPASLRRCIGIVSQDIHVFNTTIKDAIRGGETHLGDQEIVAAARAADAHDFIMALPDGYQTIVGERGSLLSGGQRQRIFLAQILARKTPVIVLDEATGALDPTSAARIHRQLEILRADKILLLITHRFDQVHNADRVYCLNEGRIVETGTYTELMAARHHFWRLANAQGAASEETSGENKAVAAR